MKWLAQTFVLAKFREEIKAAREACDLADVLIPAKTVDQRWPQNCPLDAPALCQSKDRRLVVLIQMKICMPVDQLNGLDSEIALNFRAAPGLLVIDSVSSELFGIDASSGACKATPQHIDAIVCAGGIGRGMFNGLRSHGIRVFNTDAMTVKEALAELAAGNLVEVTEVECCGGGHHDRDGAQAHEPGHDCGCGSLDNGEHIKNGCGCNHH